MHPYFTEAWSEVLRAGHRISLGEGIFFLPPHLLPQASSLSPSSPLPFPSSPLPPLSPLLSSPPHPFSFSLPPPPFLFFILPSHHFLASLLPFSSLPSPLPPPPISPSSSSYPSSLSPSSWLLLHGSTDNTKPFRDRMTGWHPDGGRKQEEHFSGGWRVWGGVGGEGH